MKYSTIISGDGIKGIFDEIKIIFYGWTILYESQEKEKEIKLIEKGTVCIFHSFTGKEHHTPPPSRYTQAKLIKELEKKGIGRPSTFSSILSTIVDRNYCIIENNEGIEKDVEIIRWTKETEQIDSHFDKIFLGAEKKRLHMTNIGTLVVSFLKQHFSFIMDYKYTSTLETQLDNIATQNISWVSCVEDAYKILSESIKKVPQQKKLSENKTLLGSFENKNVYVFSGKKGFVIQHGENDDKSTTYNILSTRKKIPTLKDALSAIPIKIGLFENNPIYKKKGPFGMYIQYKNTNISIPKEHVGNITLENCLLWIKESLSTSRVVCKKKNIIIRKGPYGFYIKRGKTIRKLPEEEDWKTITVESCLKILNTIKKKRRKKKK